VSFDPTDEGASLDKLEQCLNEIKCWMTSNWLKLNDSKTEFIIFGTKNNLSHVQAKSVTVGESTISPTSSVKSIGAHLDCHLNMENQISATCKAAWFHLYQTGKIRKFLTVDQTKSIVHAYVTSRLDQNNSLLIGLPKKSLNRLQLVQNAAARLIVGLKKRQHVTPTLIKLHWLPVEQRILFKILLLTYKSLHGKGPEYLREMLIPYTPSRTLRSSSMDMLGVPSAHYVATEKRAFGIRAPYEWNKLPYAIRTKNSVDSFKVALKTYLFKCAF